MAGGNVSPIATRDPPELWLTEEIFVDLVRRLAAFLPLAPPPRRNVGVAPVTGVHHFVLPVGGHGWGEHELPWDGDGSNFGWDDDDAYSGGWFGAVPASGDAMAALPETMVVGEQGEGKEKEECSVCLDVYEAGDTLRTMPCEHAFHGSCILGWLAVSRLCPLCRFALPPEVESDSETDLQDGGDDGEVEDSSSDDEVEDSDNDGEEEEVEDSDDDDVTLYI